MKMKIKFLTLSAILILSSLAMQAQIGFGLLGGVNFQNINGTNSNGDKLENGLLTGFHAGVNVNIPIAPDFYFQPGLLFSVKGAKNEFYNPPTKASGDYTTTTRLSYVELPVNLQIAGSILDTLVAEGGSAFLDYVSRLGLAREQDIVVLSFRQHFYFDAEEMKRARTLVNLTELNKITGITEFIRSCYRIMPQQSNLLGRFIDNKEIGRYTLNKSSSAFTGGDYLDDIENAIYSSVPFINRLYSILDSRTNARMSKSSVSLLLHDYGFKVMDMTVLNGLTYFHAQKARTA
ncbi:MAG: outer membrane beta-barrel protein [Bacteroidales bacterium]|nr:outer membrane beta-barrel protein [Bacteroidales bacterium]MDT8373520.1 outer membrane beta-barrel protein [Bacteroidales bacterium]